MQEGPMTAVVGYGSTMAGGTAAEYEAISHTVMEALLTRTDVIDPGVMLTATTGEIVVEVLVEDVEDLDRAKTIGVTAIREALDGAGVVMLHDEHQSAELLPA